MASLLPIQQAQLSAYEAACRFVPRNLRHSFILIGGAATIAHGGSGRKAKDVDIITDVACLALMVQTINLGRGGFGMDTDGSYFWEARVVNPAWDFKVTIEFIELDGPFLARVPSVVEFRNGFVANLSELLRFRCETVLNRGDEKDYGDLQLLLSLMKINRQRLPFIEEEELEGMVEAVEMVVEELGDQSLFSIFMNILSSFEIGGSIFYDWPHWARHQRLVAGTF